MLTSFLSPNVSVYNASLTCHIFENKLYVDRVYDFLKFVYDSSLIPCSCMYVEGVNFRVHARRVL